jgi:hypothetical protein
MMEVAGEEFAGSASSPALIDMGKARGYIVGVARIHPPGLLRHSENPAMSPVLMKKPELASCDTLKQR